MRWGCNDNEKHVKIKSQLYGYDTLIIRPEIVGIAGKEKDTLRKGMLIKISSKNDYLNKLFFKTHGIVFIKSFAIPFSSAATSNIILVTDRITATFIKPSDIEAIIK